MTTLAAAVLAMDGRIVQDRHNPHRVAPQERRW